MFTRTVALAASLAFIASATAQPTGFTYQGSLKDAGQPAAGPHDMRFRLFDAASGGAQVGATLCRENVAVAGGLFAVQLDFGQQFATPSPRFLEIHVRADVGQPCTDEFGYVVLSPRQAITPAPAALHANSAYSLAAPDGSPAGAVFVDNDGNVGIGTTAPTAPLHVAADAAALRLQDDDDNQSNTLLEDLQPNLMRLVKFNGTPGASVMELTPMPSDGAGDAIIRVFRQTNTTGAKVMRFHSGNNSTATEAAITVGGGDSYFQLAGGNLGIGTFAPQAKLDVRGDIGLRAPGSAATEAAIAVGGANSYFQLGGGNVGIGTNNPFAKLDVRGDIRIGASGQYRVPGGEENLRIVRGAVDSAGIRTRGTGFSAQRIDVGKYRVTFSTPFETTPTVTATCNRTFGAVRLIGFDTGSPTATQVTFVCFGVVTEEFLDSGFDFIAVGPR